MIAAKTGGPPDLETIQEMGESLTKVIEDFDRAVNVEALLLARRLGKHRFSQSGDSSISSVSCRARRT